MPRRLTTEEFIAKAEAVHGDRYDYSQVAYINGRTKSEIGCPTHGPFIQTPENHLAGQGCPACGRLSLVAKQRFTKERFIEDAEAVHGHRYDYSEVEYVNAQTKVTIICPDHGPFDQAPTSHLGNHGCPDCAGVKLMTKDEWIEKARAVHNDLYDYSEVVYVNGKTKVTISCVVHGPFEQSPSNHLTGYGCPACGGYYRYTTESFVDRAREIHGDRYDYSSVEYVNSQSHVTIICPEHGPFKQAPSQHISGRGCMECSGKRKLTTDEFIANAQMVHGARYDYAVTKYVNSHVKVSIRCLEHGIFEQSATSHLGGYGCPGCGGNKPLTTETFIEKAREIHGGRYDYSQVEYVNHSTHVTIICREHGPFSQAATSQLSNRMIGCPDCAVTGFNPSEVGILYYIAVSTDDGDTRYKIGITNHSVEDRFRAPDRARIRVVKIWRFAVGRVAAEQEADILRKFAGDRYHGPDILQSGNTELFTHDVLELDK